MKDRHAEQVFSSRTLLLDPSTSNPSGWTSHYRHHQYSPMPSDRRADQVFIARTDGLPAAREAFSCFCSRLNRSRCSDYSVTLFLFEKMRLGRRWLLSSSTSQFISLSSMMLGEMQISRSEQRLLVRLFLSEVLFFQERRRRRRQKEKAPTSDIERVFAAETQGRCPARHLCLYLSGRDPQWLSQSGTFRYIPSCSTYWHLFSVSRVVDWTGCDGARTMLRSSREENLARRSSNQEWRATVFVSRCVEIAMHCRTLSLRSRWSSHRSDQDKHFESSSRMEERCRHWPRCWAPLRVRSFQSAPFPQAQRCSRFPTRDWRRLSLLQEDRMEWKWPVSMHPPRWSWLDWLLLRSDQHRKCHYQPRSEEI